MEMSFQANLNIRAGGVAGAGTWNPVTIAQDVMVNMSFQKANASTRGGGGVTASEPSLLDLSVDGSIILVPDNARYQEMRDAALNREVIGVQAFDSNGEGWQFDAKLTEFSRSEALAEGMTHSFVLEPCYSETAPEWIEPA